MRAIIEEVMGDLGQICPEYLDYFEQKEISAKTTLLNEGEVSKWIYFVKKGALRAVLNHDGQEITTQFFFENQAVSSFMGREPSMFTIRSIERSTLVRISIENFEKLIANVPQIKDLMLEIVLQRLKHYSTLFISRIKNSPEQRYEELIRENPELLQRVPQHYIATYLGVTSVSLSRIRNRIK